MNTTFGVWYLQSSKISHEEYTKTGNYIIAMNMNIAWVSFCSPGEMNMVRQVVVQVGESDLVLCPDWLPDNDLVDIIELIPVLIPESR